SPYPFASSGGRPSRSAFSRLYSAKTSNRRIGCFGFGWSVISHDLVVVRDLDAMLSGRAQDLLARRLFRGRALEVRLVEAGNGGPHVFLVVDRQMPLAFAVDVGKVALLEFGALISRQFGHGVSSCQHGGSSTPSAEIIPGPSPGTASPRRRREV